MAIVNITRSELPDNSFEPLAPGEYAASIDDVELRETNAGTGTYLSVCYAVGARKVWQNITITNPSQKAVEIGLGQLKSLMTAVDFYQLGDTDELLNLPVRIVVGIETSEQYGNKNVVKYVKAEIKDEFSVPVAPAAEKSQSANVKAAGATPPWLKK